MVGCVDDARLGRCGDGSGAPRRAGHRQQRLQDRAAEEPGERRARDGVRAARPRIRGADGRERQPQGHAAEFARVPRPAGTRQHRALLLRRPRHPGQGTELPDPDGRRRSQRGRGRRRERQPGARPGSTRRSEEHDQRRDPRRLPRQSVRALVPFGDARPRPGGRADRNADRLRNRARAHGSGWRRGQRGLHGGDAACAQDARPQGRGRAEARPGRRRAAHERRADALGRLLLIGDFYFIPPAPVAAPQTPPAAIAVPAQVAAVAEAGKVEKYCGRRLVVVHAVLRLHRLDAVCWAGVSRKANWSAEALRTTARNTGTWPSTWPARIGWKVSGTLTDAKGNTGRYTATAAATVSDAMFKGSGKFDDYDCAFEARRIR